LRRLGVSLPAAISGLAWGTAPADRARTRGKRSSLRRQSAKPRCGDRLGTSRRSVLPCRRWQ